MTGLADVNREALSADELDRIAGGIIIVGGRNLALFHQASPFEKVALNPQPLPPMPAPGGILSLLFGR